MSPNLLMLGREVTLPLDLMFLKQDQVTYQCHNEYAEWVRKAMMENFELVRENLRWAAQRQKRLYDQSTEDRNFQVGQWVLGFYTPLRNKDKLHSPYVGPYLIVGKPGEVTYVLQESEESKPFAVHADHIKPYLSEVPLESWITVDPDRGVEEAVTVTQGADNDVIDVTDAPDTTGGKPVEANTEDAPSGAGQVVENVPTVGDDVQVRRGGRERRAPARYDEIEWE